MNELPKGWMEVTLGDLVAHRREKIIPGDMPDSPFLGLEDVEPHTSRVIKYGRAGDLKSSAARFSPGEVLYSRLRPYLNKVVLAETEGLASAEFLVLQPTGAVKADFIRRRIMTDDFLGFTASLDRGDRPRVDYSQIAKFRIHLPPIAEQQRLLVKLDMLTAATARASEELSRIPMLISNFKKTLLSRAFSGDLTRQWNESELSQKRWGETSLGDLAQIGTGATPKRGTPRYYKHGTVPWVTSSAVNSDRITECTEYITQTAIAETNCKVFPAGTLLIAMYGEGQTRGKVAILEIDAATNQALAAVQVTDPRVTRDFVYWLLRAQYLELRQQAAGGVQPNLNLGMIKTFRVPLPSLPEQHEIIRRVETSFAWLNKLEDQHTLAINLLPKLDQAILAKAFRGELVPQDPNDEPASEALSRIYTVTASVVTKQKRGVNIHREIATRTPKERFNMVKSRLDDDVKGKPYLAAFLRKMGKSGNVEELFDRAQLPVTDFYKQLAWEVESGHIRDDDKRLEAA